MNEELNNIIFGKNNQQRIVCLEPGDEQTEVFTEDEQGNVSSHFVPNAYFILSAEPLKGSVRLKGELYYKWGAKYTNREIYLKARNYYRQQDIYSVYQPKENFMIRTGYTYFKGMKHTEPTILSFDIETNGLVMDNTSKLFLISNTFRKNGTITRKLFCYDEYENEGEMLRHWCSWVREMNPSILCGHNIVSYDLPFLQQIAENNGVSLSLGRDGSDIKFDGYKSKFRKDQSQFQEYFKCHVYGREIADTFFLAVKHNIVEKKYDTLRLKSIIQIEGLEIKDRVFYDASKIRDNIDDPIERQKIKDYCIHDSDDALNLFDLISPAIFYFTQSIPKPFQLMIESATGSQLNALFIRSYLQLGHGVPKADVIDTFPGAISYGNPGVWKNCFKIDLAALYPSIALQYDIYSKAKDPNRHILKSLEYFRTERLKNKQLAKETKDNYYKNLEQSEKIAINSFFGLYGANGLNFNNRIGALTITSKGQQILKETILWATGKEYKDWNKDVA